MSDTPPTLPKFALHVPPGTPDSVPLEGKILLGALAAASAAYPAETFQCVLTWIDQQVTMMPCECGKPECPSEDLRLTLAAIHGFLERTKERRRVGLIMHGVTIPCETDTPAS